MEDLSMLWFKEIYLRVWFGLWCTTGLLPQAIAFHVLCKQIVWCYQGAPSHHSLLRWRHAVVCVYQSKQKHRAICGCHCYSALYVWMIKWYEKVFLKETPCFKFFLSIAIKNGYVWYLVYQLEYLSVPDTDFKQSRSFHRFYVYFKRWNNLHLTFLLTIVILTMGYL